MSSPRRSGSSSRQQKLEQNVVKLETQARQALAANREDLARQALERKAAAQPQLQGLDEQVQQLQDQQEKLVAGQQTARGPDRGLPLDEGSAEGAVLGGRGAGARSARRRRGSAGHGGHRRGDPAREGQDRGAAGPRVGDRRADDERRARGLHRRRPDGLDRELAQISTTNQVDSDLARLKAEVGAGDARQGARLRATRRQARARSRRSSRRGAHRHPLRPEEAQGAGGRPALRDHHRRGDARRRVRR